MTISHKILKNFDTRPRLLISVIISILFYMALPNSLQLITRLLCAWNSGLISSLIMTWWIMDFASRTEHMSHFARIEYTGRTAIYSFIITAACVSVLAIGFLLNVHNESKSVAILSLHIFIAIFTIVVSWLLVHTVFALHYANRYYQMKDQKIEAGLQFPDQRAPDYWDFLYFSFVIGMTCQVSDVQTESRQMRHLALFHGILSFFYNTSILAMSVNVIANLI